ncbi:MAG: hypothetical protein GX050_06535 [Firmicutes bacterium]|nr:hypothetical protein [Bacillota bacterium]
MLSIFREEFVKDLLVWFFVSILIAALFAAGAGLIADRYFSNTVDGLMGDQGEFDLLFQVRSDLKTEAVARLQEIIQEKVPGSTVKTGISIAGKTAVYVGLAPKYRVKEVYTNLGYYFRDIPGTGGFSLMTEPRVTIAALPGAVLDLFIREAERIPGVRFAFRDGSSIAVLLEEETNTKQISDELKRLLQDYRLLEIRLPDGYQVENSVEIGKELANRLAGQGGISLVRDVTSGQSSDQQQALLLTMAEMKKFLLSYAGQVKIIPTKGTELRPGDLVVIDGREESSLRQGERVKAEDLIVKITSAERDGELQGLIIQGESGFHSTALPARLVGDNKKIGAVVANVIVDSPKQKLASVLDESIKLLGKVNSFQDLPLQAGEVITAAETIQAALDSIYGMEAENPDLEKIKRLAALLEGTGNELESMATNLSRLRWVETQLENAIGGLEGIQAVTRLGLFPQQVAYYGDLGQKVGWLDQEIDRLLDGLREKARALDRFINQFNPLVQILLEWKSKTTSLAQQLTKVENLVGGGEGALAVLTELTGISDDSLNTLRELDFAGMREELAPFETGLQVLSETNVMMIIEQLESIKASLPKLRDEEIGKTVELLDSYLNGEVIPGEKVQLFVNAGFDEQAVTEMVGDYFKSDQVRLLSLPAGVVQPDVRNEVTRLLGEVRGVIAALAVIIMAILTFLQDQAPVLAIFHHLELVAPLPERVKTQRKRGIKIVTYRRFFPWLYAAGLGAIWLWVTVQLSGANIPYFPRRYFFLVGAFVGMLFYRMAEKFHQLKMDEVTAGYALGLSFTTVMREIVIPAGRPGLMQMLNRRKMVMK